MRSENEWHRRTRKWMPGVYMSPPFFLSGKYFWGLKVVLVFGEFYGWDKLLFLKLGYSASEKMEKQLQKEHVCFFLGEFSGAMFSFMEGNRVGGIGCFGACFFGETDPRAWTLIPRWVFIPSEQHVLTSFFRMISWQDTLSGKYVRLWIRITCSTFQHSKPWWHSTIYTDWFIGVPILAYYDPYRSV